MLRRLWLIFAQATTVGLALLFIVSTLRPEWIGRSPATLAPALADVTHVIHCAGRTKALRVSEFYDTNEQGTRHLLDAVNRTAPAIQRVVLLSSLAAARQPG